MPDSQHESGAYPKRTVQKSDPASYNAPGRSAHPAPNRSPRPAPPPAETSQADRAPRGRSLFGPRQPPSGRPVLPHAQETSEAQHERTERLRSMRQDFLDHAQTRIAPQKPRNVLLAVILTAVMLGLCITGVIAFFQLRSTIFAPGGQDVVTQFMNDMQSQNYSDAYANCASNVQVVSSSGSRQIQGKDDFIQQAQDADKNGKITAYTQTNSKTLDSATVQYTFSVTRSSTNPAHQTTATANLVVSKQDDGSWKISSIDGALLPLAPAPPAQSTPGTESTPGTASSLAHIPTQYPLDLRIETSQAQIALPRLR